MCKVNIHDPVNGFERPEDCQSKVTGGTERESTTSEVFVNVRAVSKFVSTAAASELSILN